jgi:hypothetical protein
MPGITPLTRIPVGQRLARLLDAPARLSYLAAAVPPDTDLCRGTLLVRWTRGRVFGPAEFLDTSIITRIGGHGLTEMPRSSRCRQLVRADDPDPLTTLARMLSSTAGTLTRALAG